MSAEIVNQDDMSDIAGKLSSGKVYPEFLKLPEHSAVVNLGCGIGPQAVVYRGQFSSMIGVDINEKRIKRSEHITAQLGITGYSGIVSDVESTPLDDGVADVVVAVDLAEHVSSPANLFRECRRLLKPGGSLLVTYPALHDRYIHNPVSDLTRRLTGRSTHEHASDEWDPDHHNSVMSLNNWIKLTERAGFSLEKSRASTMFPPLHLLGVPRFWFEVQLIHRIDSIVSTIPFVKRFGQSLVCSYRAI